jgi:hypothetical protein
MDDRPYDHPIVEGGGDPLEFLPTSHQRPGGGKIYALHGGPSAAPVTD